jgi:hypothetical protein
MVTKNRNHTTSGNNTTSSSANKPTNQAPSAKKTTAKTVNLGNASYSLELPDGWNLKELANIDTTNEKMVYVIDPASKVQLEVQILSRSATNGSVSSGQVSLKTFEGISGKTYYVYGFKGNSTVPNAYELLQISACADKHCYTPINDGFSLNLAIRSADLTTPISAENPLINDIVTIIQSIKLGS